MTSTCGVGAESPSSVGPALRDYDREAGFPTGMLAAVKLTQDARPVDLAGAR